MRVIHLARKPCPSSITATALEHGTGVINIDQTRIPTAEDLNGGAYSSGGRKALPGDQREGAAAGMFVEGGGRLPGQYQQPTGRWPSNLILQHLEGCRCVGEAEIKGKRGGVRHKALGIMNDDGWEPRATEDRRDWVSADGMETVAAWACVPGCPVAALDGQSGVVKGAVSNGKKRGTGFHGDFGGQDQAPGYADTGGASRFFKQVQPAHKEG